MARRSSLFPLFPLLCRVQWLLITAPVLKTHQHPLYNQQPQSTRERELFSLKGANNKRLGAVHIHTMVHLGGNVVHTGQLYFPDALTDAVYQRSPYNQRPARTTRNAADSIYRHGGKRSTLKLVRSGTAYTGSITMGVQRS